MSKTSPQLSIKRQGSRRQNWQDFIDREQSSIDQLLEHSFAEYCKKTNDRKFNSLSRTSPTKTTQSGLRTMPRRIPGMDELETLYAPMKNLMEPLPNARKLSGNTMPLPHPLWSNREDDLESDICSVVIPPPVRPVQSHAVLEQSLGHQIPVVQRTPGYNRSGSKTPIFSKRPTHLSLTSPSSSNVIYANASTTLPNRSSLMSTGSSENSESSIPSSSDQVPPATPNSDKTDMFSWSSYSVRNPVEEDDDNEEHRSVSQIGEAPSSVRGVESPCRTESTSSSVYMKMNPLFARSTRENDNPQPSHYMNVLYNAVQRQGGAGSVESAISPYLSMKKKSSNENVRQMSNADVDGILSIYAQPEVKRSSRQRSQSTSRIQEVTRSARKRLTSAGSKAKALLEFRELMREVDHKRQFRVGLNLFNSSPDLGVDFLVRKDFLELSPSSVAKFLHQNAGLSKDKIGEYLGNLQNPFSMKVLSCFMEEFNFTGQRIDKSLRQLLTRIRVPGEAQKIEKVMEEFARQFTKCNPSFANKLKHSDSVVTLAFATMLLNTDLHTPNLKEDKKMSVQEFTNNLRGVDGGADFDPKLLKSIYKAIKKQEFVSEPDHVTQTQVIQQNMQPVSSKKMPFLAEPHRRLVCLCRLYEVSDINSRKESDSNLHQRDVFLFNDILVIAKSVNSKSAKNPSYAYRDSFMLQGLEVTLFHTPVYQYGVQIARKKDGKVLVTLNSGSEHDRYKFVMDLQESIFEMDLMEQVTREMQGV